MVEVSAPFGYQLVGYTYVYLLLRVFSTTTANITNLKSFYTISQGLFLSTSQPFGKGRRRGGIALSSPGRPLLSPLEAGLCSLLSRQAFALSIQGRPLLSPLRRNGLISGASSFLLENLCVVFFVGELVTLLARRMTPSDPSWLRHYTYPPSVTYHVPNKCALPEASMLKIF